MYITNIHAAEIDLWPKYKKIQLPSKVSQQERDSQTGCVLCSEAATTVLEMLKREAEEE